MFTGIVTDLGTVRRITPGPVTRLEIETAYPVAEIAMGASVCCNGCCLSVVEKGPSWMAFDVSGETLSVTTLGNWKVGTRINLERALKIGDELGGHLVSGHVDGLAELLARDDLTDMAKLVFRAPPGLARFIAQKGSVALDGVSLTVNEVADETFSVLIIPHTLRVTTLGELHPGLRVNLEVDQMARYAARLMEGR